jgi:uncharacterized repeat protein (TIGR02543 family)
MSGGYQLFQNPTLIRGAGDTLTVYVHKDYLNAAGINVLNVTVAKNFCHSETPAYIVEEDITASVWTRPMTVTFNTNGGTAMDAMVVPYGTPASALAQIPNPTKEGYTFAGWTIGGYPIPEDAAVLQDLSIDANWTSINYSAKIVRADGTEETVSFNVENRAVYTKLRNSAPTVYAEGSKVVNSYVADGCVIEGTVENSIIFRGVHIGKGTVVKNSILLQDTFTGTNVSLNCLITDKNVVIRNDRVLSGHESMPFFISKGAMV